MFLAKVRQLPIAFDRDLRSLSARLHLALTTSGATHPSLAQCDSRGSHPASDLRLVTTATRTSATHSSTRPQGIETGTALFRRDVFNPRAAASSRNADDFLKGFQIPPLKPTFILWLKERHIRRGYTKFYFRSGSRTRMRRARTPADDLTTHAALAAGRR
ncbi:hypothetical protein EVAR_103195_1 [Eumeta japonica]|uniref:Uncharacterized protein n=1 Tax=Eumeta variegata TaxID=151549 RepID=A0A4C1YEH7_EUMVA|nr:hypothetical protein EVAR_103195_1 [Eumeta japonica]